MSEKVVNLDEYRKKKENIESSERREEIIDGISNETLRQYYMEYLKKEALMNDLLSSENEQE